MRHSFGLVFGFAVSLASVAVAQPLVERDDRIEIDWAHMKLRFYGEAMVSDNSFRSAEQRAWQDGVQYISTQLKHLRGRHVGAADANREQVEKDVASQVATTTYSLNTIYYGNGKVRVQLENALTKALYPTDVGFKLLRPEPTAAKNSGVVLRVKGNLRPQAVYRVVNEQGQPVYEAMDVAKEAFDKQFMGAWFQGPSMEEMRPVVGGNPVVVEGQAVGDGLIRVNQASWQKATAGNENLLQRAKIAIALF